MPDAEKSPTRPEPWEVTLHHRAHGPGLTTDVDRSDLRAVLAELDTHRARTASLRAVLRAHRGGFSTGPYQAGDGWRCACGEVVLAGGTLPQALEAWDAHVADASASRPGQETPGA